MGDHLRRRRSRARRHRAGLRRGEARPPRRRPDRAAHSAVRPDARGPRLHQGLRPRRPRERRPVHARRAVGRARLPAARRRRRGRGAARPHQPDHPRADAGGRRATTSSSPTWSPPTSTPRRRTPAVAAGPGTPARPRGSTASALHWMLGLRVVRRERRAPRSSIDPCIPKRWPGFYDDVPTRLDRRTASASTTPAASTAESPVSTRRRALVEGVCDSACSTTAADARGRWCTLARRVAPALQAEPISLLAALARIVLPRSARPAGRLTQDSVVPRLPLWPVGSAASTRSAAASAHRKELYNLRFRQSGS